MDTFRPLREPARSIYDALQREASKRNERTVEEWLAAEPDAVLREAIFQAHKLGLKPPSMQEVQHAERLASGHTEYASKWAIGVAEAMTPNRE